MELRGNAEIVTWGVKQNSQRSLITEGFATEDIMDVLHVWKAEDYGINRAGMLRSLFTDASLSLNLSLN